MFGGLIMAQAVEAAIATAGDGYEMHVRRSTYPGNACRCDRLTQGKFLNPAKVQKIQYEVSKLRDGRSYRTRRVDAFQGKLLVFTCSMSFQLPEPDQPSYFPLPPTIVEGTVPATQPQEETNIPAWVLPPEKCRTTDEFMDESLANARQGSLLARYLELSKKAQAWLPVEYRYVLPLTQRRRPDLVYEIWHHSVRNEARVLDAVKGTVRGQCQPAACRAGLPH